MINNNVIIEIFLCRVNFEGFFFIITLNNNNNCNEELYGV
jgi:hypothetical protein